MVKVKVECEDRKCNLNVKGFCTSDRIRIIHGAKCNGLEWACRECNTYVSDGDQEW